MKSRKLSYVPVHVAYAEHARLTCEGQYEGTNQLCLALRIFQVDVL
jgi:hypothetical protein